MIPLLRLLHFFIFALDSIVASSGASTAFRLWASAEVLTRSSAGSLTIHRFAHAIEGLFKLFAGRFDATDIIGGKCCTHVGNLGLQFALLLRGDLVAHLGEALLGAIGRAIGQI